MSQLINNDTIATLIASMQELEGSNQKVNLVAALVGRGITANTGMSMATLTALAVKDINCVTANILNTATIDGVVGSINLSNLAPANVLKSVNINGVIGTAKAVPGINVVPNYDPNLAVINGMDSDGTLYMINLSNGYGYKFNPVGTVLYSSTSAIIAFGRIGYGKWSSPNTLLYNFSDTLLTTVTGNLGYGIFFSDYTYLKMQGNATASVYCNSAGTVISTGSIINQGNPHPMELPNGKCVLLGGNTSYIQMPEYFVKSTGTFVTIPPNISQMDRAILALFSSIL